jgi:NAD(P)-dependent dehydrogenase (short-subunit alcohol dehydrogenase family)
MARVVEQWGRIDVLVASVRGTAVPALVHELPAERIADDITSTLLPAVHSCRAALPFLRAGGGAIVTIASDAAKVATPGEAAIGAAMAGIVMFSKTLAMEAKRDGIRVNVVTPSLVTDSGGYRAVMADPFSTRLFEKAIPLARLGVPDPDDLAELVVFLAGPRAARITGQVVSVNGGISAG